MHGGGVKEHAGRARPRTIVGRALPTGPQVRPALVMAGTVCLALKGHGRDLPLKGLLATSAVATPTAGRRGARAAPSQTFQGPSSAMTF